MYKRTSVFIDGDWVECAPTQCFEVLNCSTEEPIGVAALAGHREVDLAVQAASRALQSGWAGSPPEQRCEMLNAVSRGIQARAADFAELIATEVGSPITWAMTGQVLSAAMVFDYYAQLVRSFEFEEQRPGAFSSLLVRREPVGVVAAIVPWNFPLFISALKLAPILASGSTAVLKAAPQTALDAYLLADVISEAGFPAGVVNVVAAGSSASEALVAHPDVDKVSFTGSVATGRRVGELSGKRGCRATLELGGKSPAVILDDADIEQAAQQVVASALANNGQACVALTRVIVAQSRYADMVDCMSEIMSRSVVGDALDPTTTLGPLASDMQRARVESYVNGARNDGARCAFGAGGRPEAQTRGWFVSPTLLCDVPAESPALREEIFGPVLCVQPHSGVDEAVRLANETEYGLSGAVFGADADVATDVARRIRSGTVSVNSANAMDFAGPFGGMKHSGHGRELGPEGLENFLDLKTITLPYNG